MKLTNENILIASLLGSKVVESIPRFAAVENEMMKHVVPPIPFLPIKGSTNVSGYESATADSELWQSVSSKDEKSQFFPFSFRLENEKESYLLPWEPMINISGGATLAERKIAKSGSDFIGSIIERWSTNAFEITITGAIYGKSMKGNRYEAYPREEMQKLKKYLLSGQRIYVESEPLQILGINRIVIREFNFPFTKGEEVQAYEIKAVSDHPYNLLYERKQKGKIVGGDLDLVGVYQ